MSDIPTPTPVDELVTRRLRPRGAFKTFFLSLVIFVCGGAAGWALSMGLHHPPPPQGQGMAPEPPVGQLVQRLRNELLLTDDQVRQVTQIYQDRDAALRAIRQQMGPEYNKLRDEMQKVLTPPQFVRWNQRFEDVRNRMLPPPRGGPMGFGPGGPGRGGPGGRGGPDGGGGPGGGGTRGFGTFGTFGNPNGQDGGPPRRPSSQPGPDGFNDGGPGGPGGP
jgi:hypothetical protein